MTTPHRVEAHAQQFLTVNGKRMAYVELGSGARFSSFCTATRPPLICGATSCRKLPRRAAVSRRI
jgi:hypothetical protein